MLRDLKFLLLLGLFCIAASNGYFDSVLGSNPDAPRDAHAASARPAASPDPGRCARSPRTVTVRVDGERWPHVAAHVRQARGRYRRVLHVARTGTATHRAQSLAAVAPASGHARNAYPPSIAREGGSGAHVAYVPAWEHRGAVAQLSAALARYCAGQHFRLVAR